MKVKLYIDLDDNMITDEKNIFALGNPSSQKMNGYSRYLIEVDLPIHHFKPIADRKIEAVVIGKEED